MAHLFYTKTRSNDVDGVASIAVASGSRAHMVILLF